MVCIRNEKPIFACFHASEACRALPALRRTLARLSLALLVWAHWRPAAWGRRRRPTLLQPRWSPSQPSVNSHCSAPAPGYAGLSGAAPGGARDPPARSPEHARVSTEAQKKSSPQTRRLRRRSKANRWSGAAAPTQGTTELTKPNQKALTPANLLDRLQPNGRDAVQHADGLRSSTCSTARPSHQTCRSSQRAVRTAGLQRSQRLLSQGQPGRAKLRRCRPPAANSNAAGRRRSPPTWRSHTGSARAVTILLVEAESNSNANLYAAEQTAASLGATEISNSWGGGEPSQRQPGVQPPRHRRSRPPRATTAI